MSSEAVVLASDMPVGMRFCPSEEEVIDHYLKLKRLGLDSQVDPYIAEVDFCMWDPWELPCQSKLKSNDNEWWFSSRPCYNNSIRKRKTKTGTWKITGEEKEIKGCIGMKRFLTFYLKDSHTLGERKRTDWVIHEYYYPEPNIPPRQQKPTCVICCLKYDPHKKGSQKAGTPESPDSLFIEQMLSFLLDNEKEAHDEMQPPLGADELNKNIAELEKLLNVDTGENNTTVATTGSLSCNTSLRASLKRSYQDGPVRSDLETEVVDERLKRYHSFAVG